MEDFLTKYINSCDYTDFPFKTDSREVVPGDVFFAIKGIDNDGHKYISEVFSKGAEAVICEYVPEELDAGLISKIKVVDDVRTVLGKAVSIFYKDPASRLEVYGVTGTNGKTSTVFLIDHILSCAGKTPGFLSTVFTKVSGDEVTRSYMTTPDVVSVYKALSGMLSSGKSSAVVEVSSHALNQSRVWGVGLDCAVFTNITPEHLDYHLTMERYLADKVRIFDLLKKGGTAVVNADDEKVLNAGKSLSGFRVLTFGVEPSADIRAENIDMSAVSTGFDLVIEGADPIRISSPLIGLHNVRNMLAASAAAYSRGIPVPIIAKGLAGACSVPGRLELVSRENDPYSVFVDYAHTPDALDNVLRCLKPLTEGKLISVFGCGGDRDRSKRPVMGAIAAKFSDTVILTNDNPRSEDPSEILGEIEIGIPAGTAYSVVPDREEAIREALREADKGDVVLIAGKGHEDYQILGDGTIHFDDKEVVMKVLNNEN